MGRNIIVIDDSHIGLHQHGVAVKKGRTGETPLSGKLRDGIEPPRIVIEAKDIRSVSRPWLDRPARRELLLPDSLRQDQRSDYSAQPSNRRRLQRGQGVPSPISGAKTLADLPA